MNKVQWVDHQIVYISKRVYKYLCILKKDLCILKKDKG